MGLTPNIKYRLHDEYAIMMMVEAGLGISIIAELILRRIHYDIVVLPTDPPIKRIVGISYKDKNSLPIASKYFIAYLLEHVDDLP